MNKPGAMITINGKDYTRGELSLFIAQKLSHSTLTQWENELYLFLQEWLTDQDTIGAQTSGSTGVPQSIRLSKAMMEQSAQRTIAYFNLKKGDRLLLSLPCRYIAGKMMVIRAITGQMDLITVDPSLESDLLLNSAFDLGAMVPNQVIKLMESPNGKEKIENIRNLLIGGSSIQPFLEAQVSGLSNQVVSTYGMTETASHIAIRTLSGPKRSEVYECLPGITVSLSKNDCLQIHLPDQQTFHTKDIAEILSPVRFSILGRADDVIISGGIKYWPENLEKKLEQVIAGRFVISSLPDKKLGEKLVLVMEGTPSDNKNIRQKMTQLLPPFERPKDICYLHSFPETENGKIKRKEIKRRIGE
ncbi:MAG TPA: AMP-binding protein [Prolixibacteraceae bacterium]|nr:AMP-binding protein [Prolixibacteraceae bacterium]